MNFLPKFTAAPLRGFAKRCYRRAKKNDGGSLVEFMVTLPLILLIMTGIFSFSVALWQKITLSEAMSVGGRLLAVDRGDHDPCATVTTAIYNAAPSLTQSNLTLTFQINGVNYGSNVKTCPGAASAANTDMVSNGTATIWATYPISLTVYGSSFSNMSLGGRITEVIQ